MGVAEDAGQDWSGASYGVATIDGCSYTDAKAAILQAGDAIVMRSDNDHPYYKYVSVREIDPMASIGEDGGEEGPSAIRRIFRPSLENVPVRHFDLLGRRVPAKK